MSGLAQVYSISQPYGETNNRDWEKLDILRKRINVCELHQRPSCGLQDYWNPRLHGAEDRKERKESSSDRENIIKKKSMLRKKGDRRKLKSLIAIQKAFQIARLREWHDVAQWNEEMKIEKSDKRRTEPLTFFSRCDKNSLSENDLLGAKKGFGVRRILSISWIFKKVLWKLLYYVVILSN